MEMPNDDEITMAIRLIESAFGYWDDSYSMSREDSKAIEANMAGVIGIVNRLAAKAKENERLLRAIVEHERLHKEAHAKAWNEACDLVINDLLNKPKSG